jgi:hypothetical protein
MNHRHLLLPLVLSILATGVHAGTIAGGSWSPAGCGIKPVAPKLDLRDPDAYNKSTEGVNGYRLAIRAYLDCAVKEANGDIQSITKSAAALQQAAREADDAIVADVKAADKKFGK